MLNIDAMIYSLITMYLLYIYSRYLYTYGNIPSVVVFGGRPFSGDDKLLMSWCTAAFAIPYPIIPKVGGVRRCGYIVLLPGVPSRQALAPVNTSTPFLYTSVG